MFLVWVFEVKVTSVGKAESARVLYGAGEVEEAENLDP